MKIRVTTNKEEKLYQHNITELNPFPEVRERFWYNGYTTTYGLEKDWTRDDGNKKNHIRLPF